MYATNIYIKLRLTSYNPKIVPIVTHFDTIMCFVAFNFFRVNSLVNYHFHFCLGKFYFPKISSYVFRDFSYVTKYDHKSS